jgi:hypothetical protein
LNAARYSKFITVLLGEAVAYVQLYGAVFHLTPAMTMAGVALAVLGVPNAPPGGQASLVSEITAAVDQLLGQRLRPPRPAQPPAAPGPPPAPPAMAQVGPQPEPATAAPGGTNV